jgi:hypothetical protein
LIGNYGPRARNRPTNPIRRNCGDGEPSRPSASWEIDADQINLAQQARKVARFCVRRSQQPPRYNRCADSLSPVVPIVGGKARVVYKYSHDLSLVKPVNYAHGNYADREIWPLSSECRIPILTVSIAASAGIFTGTGAWCTACIVLRHQRIVAADCCAVI